MKKENYADYFVSADEALHSDNVCIAVDDCDQCLSNLVDIIRPFICHFGDDNTVRLYIYDKSTGCYLKTAVMLYSNVRKMHLDFVVHDDNDTTMTHKEDATMTTTRSIAFQVRLTPQEHKDFCELAQLRGLSLSSLIRYNLRREWLDISAALEDYDNDCVTVSAPSPGGPPEGEQQLRSNCVVSTQFESPQLMGDEN